MPQDPRGGGLLSGGGVARSCELRERLVAVAPLARAQLI